MRIKPETSLAVWAVGTAWLLVYVLTHYGHHQLGMDINLVRWIRIGVAVVGLALFIPFRKWFRVWLNRTRAD